MLKAQAKQNDSRTRQSDILKYFWSSLFLILFLMPLGHVFADEWNKGGNLHYASVYRWMRASEANRLATSADWFMAMTKESNKPLLDELKAMNKVDYQAAFKYYATRLESCIAEKLERKRVRPEDRVSVYAEKCYQILHGEDSL